MFPSPCFRIEEVLRSTLTFAGVDKTVIAAFDYKRFKKANPRARLLFVSHRKEILEQSIQTFQGILKSFKAELPRRYSSERRLTATCSAPSSLLESPPKSTSASLNGHAEDTIPAKWKNPYCKSQEMLLCA